MAKIPLDEYMKQTWGTCNDTIRSHLLPFLKAPCPPSQCYQKMKIWHFTCLTCMHRRYQRDPNGKFRKYKRAMILLEKPSGQEFILPKRYRAYGIFIPVGVDGQAVAWKRICLKLLLTVAERIAEV